MTRIVTNLKEVEISVLHRFANAEESSDGGTFLSNISEDGNQFLLIVVLELGFGGKHKVRIERSILFGLKFKDIYA